MIRREWEKGEWNGEGRRVREEKKMEEGCRGKRGKEKKGERSAGKAERKEWEEVQRNRK